MKRQILGLDINDELVAATVLEMRGQDPVVTAAGFSVYHSENDLTEAIPKLFEEVRWKGGTCITGISVSETSLRNIALPFTENRKIAQILPLELEDQLLSPIQDQLVEYTTSKIEKDHSHLLVTTITKERVKEYLDLLAGNKVTPEVITLRTLVFAEQLQRQPAQPKSFLVVDAGMHAANIALVIDKQVVFLRRIVYVDSVFTEHPVIFDANGPSIVNHDEAMECFSALCKDIVVSLGLFQLETGLVAQPELIYVNGIMGSLPEFIDKMTAELDNKEVRSVNLQQVAGVKFGQGQQEKWVPGICDHALALALQGFRKKATVNFRKGEFALPKLYYAAKNQLAAAAVVVVALLATTFIYLGYDYRGLKTKNDELGGKIIAIYKETFPDVKTVNRPSVALADMQVKLRNVKGPSISTPIFSGDKRSLNILADISGRIPASIKIDVARMVIDKETITIKGTTDTFNNVNLIQNVLRKSTVYEDVDIVSAAAEKDGGSIRFELRLQTVKTS